MVDVEDYTRIREIANEDVDMLIEKGKTYGSSWRNRGGIGAFMMLARKWDRLENICRRNNYDIFRAIEMDKAEIDGVLDDIEDLRRYLLLVEAHVTGMNEPIPAGQTMKDQWDGTEHK